MAIEVIISGFIIGIFFGWILQRGRVCFNTGIRDPLVFRDFSILKGIFFAISLSMITFGILQLTGITTPNPKPLIWPNQLVGGFIFGMGMVLAAACASGVTYKTGEGIMTAFMGLLGLAMGATSAGSGFLQPLRSSLEGTYSMGAVTLGSLVGIDNGILMVVIGVILTILIAWRFWLPERRAYYAENQGGIGGMFGGLIKRSWPWFVFGIALAILNTIAWPLSAAAGRNYPLGITGGWLDLFKSFTFDPLTTTAFLDLGWLSWVVLGVILGSFFGAQGAGEYKMASPKTGKPIMLAFIGGLMLGAGAVFSKGCNIGNFLSGVPQLSFGSMLFSVFMFLGVWFMAYIIFVWRKSDILE
jgi:uncharacterized membrane protein YedE/YeeE